MKRIGDLHRDMNDQDGGSERKKRNSELLTSGRAMITLTALKMSKNWAEQRIQRSIAFLAFERGGNVLDSAFTTTPSVFSMSFSSSNPAVILQRVALGVNSGAAMEDMNYDGGWNGLK